MGCENLNVRVIVRVNVRSNDQTERLGSGGEKTFGGQGSPLGVEGGTVQG